MSNGDEEGGAVIILSFAITPELADCLDHKIIPSGAFGSTREEVAQGFLCRQFSLAVPAKAVPEQADQPVEAASADDGGGAPPTVSDAPAVDPLAEPKVPGDNNED